MMSGLGWLSISILAGLCGKSVAFTSITPFEIEITRRSLQQRLQAVPEDSDSTSDDTRRRRYVLQTLAAVTFAVPVVAHAGVPEIDKSGQRFTPKSEMLSGGSAAARGIPLRGSRTALKPGESLQTVYETRFITYLARFLLNFDPAANSWWRDQGFLDVLEPPTATSNSQMENAFAEFAESVEVGLADYFVGPYGSYSSPSAAGAGILAAEPARSLKPEERRGVLERIAAGKKKVADQRMEARNIKVAKQGILNLFALLQARYDFAEAKIQLAVLFSFITSPQLQPTYQICSLLGEADNATISTIDIVKPNVPSEADSRTSARRGGGYSLDEPPMIRIGGPPPLGDKFKQATARPIMRPTSRVLRITVVDGGEGYITSPQVSIRDSGYEKQCQATAVLDREGRVESVVVLDPGYGYGLRKEIPPKVVIEPPRRKQTARGSDAAPLRRARAIAELEYEIVAVDVVSGGSGYVMTEPPLVSVSPPEEDPDWFIAVQPLPKLRMQPFRDRYLIEAVVGEMKSQDGKVVFSANGPVLMPQISDRTIEFLQQDPLALLPPYVRPESDQLAFGKYYGAPSLLASVPQRSKINPRFRAEDPLFGGVGNSPVTMGARSLTTSEYIRLAASGAVCTVLVRTALNPLELIKTKQQLQNDKELFAYASQPKVLSSDTHTLDNAPPNSSGRSSFSRKKNVSDDFGGVVTTLEPHVETKKASGAPKADTNDKETLGTVDILQSLVSLRGPKALFQSADITFLASLVFGSFGFGATELFRRSFSSVFFSETAGNAVGNEIVLLAAAALATVLTAAAASPFEVLRVRSMGLVEDKKWSSVLQGYVEQNDITRSVSLPDGSLDFQALRPRDIIPLWSGFAPILSRELPFAVTKFLIFDLIGSTVIAFLNSNAAEGALPIQIGVGPLGLTVSAAAGAIAGIGGAIVSHPADLILTKTSARSQENGDDGSDDSDDWRDIVKELIGQEGGIANLFVGLPARATFFFLVIGLQFFLYDYVKGIFQVTSDDLSLILDVFYSVRAGLVSSAS